MMIDMRVAELLSSRLCHDLVGPIGAIGNGLELMVDDEFGMADDATELAAKSADQASTLLQFYRLAYGMAGSRQGGDMKPIRELAEGFLGHHKATLDWSAEAPPDGTPDGAGKLILNMVALAAECLPRGGTVGVGLTAGGGKVEVEVKAVGTDAGLRDEARAGLADGVDVEALSPRNVHGYFTRQVARRLGGDLSAEQAGPGYFRLAANLPA